MDSRFKDVFDHLYKYGIETYFQGQHKGDCKTNYVVIGDGGGTKFFDYSSTVNYINLMVYIPVENIVQLQPFVNKVENIMKELRPMVDKSGLEQPSFIDDTNKSVMKSLQYLYYRQITEI